MKRAWWVSGIVLSTMASGCSTKEDRYAAQHALAEEVGQRALRETDAGRVIDIASNTDVQFEDGFSGVHFNPKDDIRAFPYRWMADHAHVRLRKHGEKTMHLAMAGWVDHKYVKSKIVINLYIDGYFMPLMVNEGKPTPLEDPKFFIDAYVPAGFLHREWVDLHIRPSSVGEHWLRVVDLNAITVERLEWKEVP
jgi:hypothetical protein